MIGLISLGACGLFCLWVLKLGHGKPYRSVKRSDVPMGASTAYLQPEIRRQVLLEQTQAEARYHAKLARETKKQAQAQERAQYVKTRHQQWLDNLGNNEIL